MAKPIIVITGANGFLGSHLVEHFAGKGWQVRALVRTPKANTKHVTYHAYDLAKPVNKTVFQDAKYLVHAAYIKQSRQYPEAKQLNITAAKRLLAASRRHRLKKNVFISSMSAHEDAISAYGQQKFAIEKLFDSPRDVALRPGLIIGNGGIVKQMTTFMQRWHVVPLVGGGQQPLQTIAVDDLVTAIDHSLAANIHGVLTVAHPRVHTYRQFYRQLCQALDLRVTFLPVPYYGLYAVLRFIELLPLPTSISTDNLRGLKKLRSTDTKDDLKRLKLQPKSLVQAVRVLH